MRPPIMGLFLVAVPFGVSGARGAPEASKPHLEASPEDMAWWRDAKFGLFVHWGPVSLKGTEIGWSRGGERRGRSGRGSIPAEVYDNLYKEFNPVEFDADQWIAILKATRQPEALRIKAMGHARERSFRSPKITAVLS